MIILPSYCKNGEKQMEFKLPDTYSYYIQISGHHYCFKENIISNQWFIILYQYSLKLPELKVVQEIARQ